jgi:hypothetical protein
MIGAEVLVAIGTGFSALATSEVVKSLTRTVRRRVSKGSEAQAKRIQIAKIAAGTQGADSTVTQLIGALEGTGNAVVVAGDLAVVKDSAKGEPHIVVKQLSSGQREKIRKQEAPVNDAAAFQTWLESA